MVTTPLKITVTKNGPYEISGDIPISPKRVVTSERGEPLTWSKSGEALPHDSPTWLCRCGQSSKKPFCDDTHLTIDFDGTETASTDPFFERHKTYEGTGITVHRVGALCAHASFCANRVTDWYQMLPETSETNIRTEVIGMIEHCPSGALMYEIDGQIIEPDLPRAISPVQNGPLFLTGNVTLIASDGTALETRNRITLCRCGRSKNKPFCDGTHFETGFKAMDGSGPVVDEAPLTLRRPRPAPAVGTYHQLVMGISPKTSDEAYAVVSMVAAATSSDLTLIHCGQADEASTIQVLTKGRQRATQAGISRKRITVALRTERPGSALPLAAEETEADLLVLGRGGDRLARVARQVLQQAPCDVLVVAPRGADRPDRYRRVLVATDGSATADRAARRGYDLARALDAMVDLVFVGHPATGELIASDTISVCGDDVQSEVHLVEGNPAKRILEIAHDVGTDLVVVGNKGIERSRMLHGESVPGAVLTGARTDVLLRRTVRQREAELEPGEGGVIERDDEQLAAYLDEGGELHLLSARCPHLGCVVAWNPTDRTFDCPCHGSRFTPRGDVIDGPATRSLDPR
jgi:CDGSH-type Zn-finger protein/nucleotide-binding universal stress UspA family protein/nitrite reductase/ring-hydroxylating ferredoxin subunit